MKTLSVKRKKDREIMAGVLAQIAHEAGAKADVEEGLWGPRSLIVRIEHVGGACLNIDLDGDSSIPETHVLSWHMARGSEKQFNPGWWSAVNRFHFHKATVIAEGYGELCRVLRRDLEACESGAAYRDPPLTIT